MALPTWFDPFLCSLVTVFKMDSHPEFRKFQFSIGMLLTITALAAVILFVFEMTDRGIQGVPEWRDGILKIKITGEGHHRRATFRRTSALVFYPDSFEVIEEIEKPLKWFNSDKRIALYPNKGPIKVGSRIFVYGFMRPNWCYCDKQETKENRVKILAYMAIIACVLILIYSFRGRNGDTRTKREQVQLTD
jgi:hypothetical protein